MKNREIYNIDAYEWVQNSLERLAKEFPKRRVKHFIFMPIDYSYARDILLASTETAIGWNNSGYNCYIEKSGAEVYYDLLLTGTKTTVMLGETVEAYGTINGSVLVRVPNDDNAYSIINLEFFDKNFVETEKETRKGKGVHRSVAELISDATRRSVDASQSDAGVRDQYNERSLLRSY